MECAIDWASVEWDQADAYFIVVARLLQRTLFQNTVNEMAWITQGLPAGSLCDIRIEFRYEFGYDAIDQKFAERKLIEILSWSVSRGDFIASLVQKKWKMALQHLRATDCWVGQCNGVEISLVPFPVGTATLQLTDQHN